MWLHWEQEVVYFLTFCVAGRDTVLANDRTFDALERAIGRLTKWSVGAAIMMPDHVHLLVTPNDREEPVGNVAAALKRWMRRDLAAMWQWQPSSFDRLLRSDESAEEKWHYIWENPMRAGLVERWEDWPYRVGFRL